MSRRNKKRTKRYQGEDAALPTSNEPVVHHYSAVDRGRLGQWWFEKKRSVTLIAKVVGIGAVVVWLLYELVISLT